MSQSEFETLEAPFDFHFFVVSVELKWGNTHSCKNNKQILLIAGIFDTSLTNGSVNCFHRYTNSNQIRGKVFMQCWPFWYREFHRFGQDLIWFGSMLESTALGAAKMTLASKLVNIDLKIII